MSVSPSSSTSTTPTKDTSKEFKSIVEAYELLRSPQRRSVYLRSGYGWTSRSSKPPGARTNAGYDFSRGRPMPRGGPGANRGTYPSAAYDGWTDPFNPHYRPGYEGTTGMGTTRETGWNSKGYIGSNGIIFLGCLALTVIITPLSFYNLVPPSSLLPADSRYSDPAWGGLSNGRDDRHMAAARALTEARKEARNGGDMKREALKRRVRQIEAERAYDRALEVQRISRGTKETGHLFPTNFDPPPNAISPSNSNSNRRL